jgi:hypothetical protein
VTALRQQIEALRAAIKRARGTRRASLLEQLARLESGEPSIIPPDAAPVIRHGSMSFDAVQREQARQAVYRAAVEHAKKSRT